MLAGDRPQARCGRGHGSRGPAHDHPTVLPPLDPPGYVADRANDVLRARKSFEVA
jgi:hypothetical protein